MASYNTSSILCHALRAASQKSWTNGVFNDVQDRLHRIFDSFLDTFSDHSLQGGPNGVICLPWSSSTFLLSLPNYFKVTVCSITIPRVQNTFPSACQRCFNHTIRWHIPMCHHFVHCRPLHDSFWV